MKWTQFSIVLIFMLLQTAIYAQIKDGVNLENTNSKGVEEIGITNDALIEEMMPLMPGLGSSSREILTEQSV